MTFVRVVDTARSMIAAEGTDSLSMRKLAAELGVAPTAIYWHVGDRRKLLDAVLDQELADLTPLTARGDCPADRVRSVSKAIRNQIQRAPHVQLLALDLDRYGEVSFPAQVALARELTAAGLTGDAAAEALRSILYLIGGHAVLESNFARRPGTYQSTQQMWAEVCDDTIDVDLLRALAQPADTDRVFSYALDRMIESILK